MFFWRIFFFLYQNESKSSLFLLASSPQPPSMGLPICIFSEHHMGSWLLAYTDSGEGPGWSEWGSVCLHSQDRPQPRAQKPSPSPCWSSPDATTCAGPRGISDGEGWLWSFDIFTGRICTVMSLEQMLSSPHALVWEATSQLPCRLIYSWCFHKEQNVACGSTMASALYPQLHRTKRKLYTLVKTLSSPFGGRRGLLVLCSNKSSQE